MDNALHTHFGLTFHPFHPDVPSEALHVDAQLASFLFRVEQQVHDGGFVAVVGDPGTGESAALRVLTSRLDKLKDVSVAVLTRPQSNKPDFYRELGHLLGVTLSPHNRWARSKVLRETWLSNIDETRTRPVIVIDEAQEMQASVLGELRLLSSMNLDARALLTVVLAGDERLTAQFRTPDTRPIASRVRARLHLGYAEPGRLRDALDHVLQHAGRPDLLCGSAREERTGRLSVFCQPARRRIGRLSGLSARVGLSNHRLLEVTSDSVTFRTRGDSAVSVPKAQFVQRLLHHILPPRFVKIRHYGLMANGRMAARRERARQLLEADARSATPSRPRKTNFLAAAWERALLRLTAVDLRRCSRCGRLAVVREPLDTRPGLVATRPRPPPASVSEA